MRVHYNYLPDEFADIDEIVVEWRELAASSQYTLGKYVEEFEDIFRNFVGSKYCISTNNGTDALILGLKALGIGSGDEVISVTNTFYATIGAIVACGATPVLVDCDDRFQIDPTKIEEAISPKTKCIVPVHWGGASPNMPEILELARKHDLFVLEDACMGIGASVHKQSPGTFGQVGAFSMHPLKSLNVMGDGGMVVTDDDSLAAWMRKYRNHGMVNRDEIEFWGVNMRLQPLQAVVAKHRLNDLESTIRIRNSNAGTLDKLLAKFDDKIHIPRRLQNYNETFALYMGLFENRDDLQKHLLQYEIETKVHYPIPLHLQKAASANCIISGDLRNAELQAKKLLTIPVHQFLTSSHMEYVGEKIRNFYSI